MTTYHFTAAEIIEAQARDTFGIDWLKWEVERAALYKKIAEIFLEEIIKTYELEKAPKDSVSVSLSDRFSLASILGI